MRSLSSLFSITLVLLAFAAQSSSQTKADNCQDSRAVCAYQKPLNDLLNLERASTKNQTKIDDALKSLINPEQLPEYLVLALSEGSVFDNVVNAWERSRTDKQVGPWAKATATTDLVSRPSTPELLGLGMQVGALTETVSGSAATFNANAYGAYQAILERPVMCLVCSDSHWKNLNFAATFDLSRQAGKQVKTGGAANSGTPAVGMVQLPQSSRQLSGITVRYDIYNPLDPRSKEFKKAWSTAFQNHQQELADAAKSLNSALQVVLDPLIKDADLGKLQTVYMQRLIEDATANNSDQLKKDFEAYFDQVSQLAHKDIPDLESKIATADAAFARYSQINYSTVQEARGKPQFTAEYNYNHPVSQPDTHDFRLIFGYSPKSVIQTLFTLNLASSIYGGSIPAGAKYGRLRDFQFAAQLDRPLGDPITHPATLTVAGYVQYQFDPSVLNIGPGNLVPGTSITLPGNAQVLLGTKGTLGIVQAKITINGKSGLNIPIGVSWANKTDLLNATDVRGHIGITYDFNSIGQLFGR